MDNEKLITNSLKAPTHKKNKETHDYKLIKKDSETTQYKCVHCEEIYPTMKEVKEHINKIHPDKILYKRFYITNPYKGKCYYCNLDIKRLFQKEHYEKFHFKNGKYHCSVCKKTFNTHKRLKYHSIIHFSYSQECTICGYRSHQTQNMVSHLRNKHFKFN